MIDKKRKKSCLKYRENKLNNNMYIEETRFNARDGYGGGKKVTGVEDSWDPGTQGPCVSSVRCR